jgi:hypothetical protein
MTHPESDLKTMVPVSVTMLGIKFQNGKTTNANTTVAIQTKIAMNIAFVLTM